MPRSGNTSEMQVRLRRCARGDRTTEQISHPVHPRPNPCSGGPRSPDRTPPAPHLGGWRLRARQAARPGAALGRQCSSLQNASPSRPHPVWTPPAPQAPRHDPPSRGVLPDLTARSPASPRPKSAPPPPGLARFRRAGRGRLVVSRVDGQRSFRGLEGGAVFGVGGPMKGLF